MKGDKRSYPGQNREHKFVIGKQKKGERNKFKLIWDANKENQVENGSKENRESKNIYDIIGVGLIFIFAIIVSEVLFELYLIPKGLHNAVLKGNIIYEMIIFIVNLLSDWDELKYFRKYDESWIEGMVNALKQSWDVLSRVSLLHLLLLIGIGFFVGGRMGEKELINDVKRIYMASVYVLNNEEVEVLSDSGIQSPEMKNVLSGKDQEMVEKAKKISVSGDGQNRKMNLSQEDYDTVYFSGGEYDISKLDNQDDISEVIKRFVAVQRKKERENVFDKPDDEGGAPSEMEEMIANASERENKAESFEEIEDILGDREDAYLKYPKATLAKLISNGYEMMALVLMLHGGNIESINYYYGQSILKDFEYLEYADISDANIKKRLMKISQKYEDMRVINSDWKAKFPTVMELRDAFQEAADQY
ncbi:MAG: hypothetical protein K2O65_03345 [Lachnospiraceae bacterium]|nr:hypothetical protein [Lachnospiraceae bacterium]